MMISGTYRRSFVPRILAASLLSVAMLTVTHAQYERAEAPFGDRVSERIPFYHRAAPTIATSGPLGRLGLIEAKGVGFKSVLNLSVSTTAAGLGDAAMATYVVLGYFSVAITDWLPTQDQVAEVRRILNASENGPILMYGADRDQAAAAWALVRAASGIPSEIALQEGLTAGLRDRLPAVRERLGLGGAATR
jgi:hypothetical protein